MSASVTAGSITVDVFSVATPLGVDWRWIALGGFIIFVILVYWGWYSTHRKLEEYENKLSSVVVTPRCEGKFAWLEVNNTGQYQARFKVNIVELNGVEQNVPTVPKIELPYIAKWLNTHDQQDFELKADDNHKVQIAESGGLIGFTEDPTKYQKVLLPTHWMTWEGKILINSSIKLSVKIISEPKLKLPFEKTYTLFIDQNGMWQQFKEI